MPISPIGPLSRTNDTLNADNQPGDHNVFQAKIDELVAAVNAGPEGEPLDTFLEAFAGLQVASGAWRRWLFSTNRIRNICCIGDSTTQEGIEAPDDPFVNQLMRAFGQTIGPLAGYGLRNVGFGLSATTTHDWAFGRTILAQMVVATYSKTVAGCTTHSGSTLVDGTGFTNPNDVGAVVSGAGIQAGSVITNTSSAQFQMDKNATASATVTLTFTRTTPATGYTADTNRLVAQSGAFVAADVGSAITGNGIPAATTIVSQTGTTAILSAACTTPSGTPVAIDTDVAWTRTVSTDAFDVGPAGECFYVTTGQTPATAITWTKPAFMTAPLVGLDVLWADGWAGAPGWQWTVDDWATVNTVSAAARTGSNKLKKTTIVAAVAARFQIRAVSGTTPVDVGIVGVTPYIVNPTTGSGVMVHNIGRDGFALATLVTGGAGDRMAVLDDGSTHPGALNPNLVVGCYTNDVVLINSAPTFVTDLGILDAYVGRHADVAWWNAFERLGPAPADQAAYRAATKAFCAANGWGLLDVYDAWAAMVGTGGYASANGAGLMYDAAHESQAGMNDIAARWRRALLTFS